MRAAITRIGALLAGAALCLATSVALAEMRLIDRETNPEAWTTATKSLRVHGAWDLADLPDFGVTSSPGPLTAQGAGPIPAGFLPAIVEIDGTHFFPNEPISLAYLGPSANGANNLYNAIVPNQPQDALVISFAQPVLAFEFDAVSCSNCFNATGIIDIRVLDDRGDTVLFEGLAAPATGNLYGIVASKGRRIVSIMLSGPDPVGPGILHYHPGIQGAATYYEHGKPKD